VIKEIKKKSDGNKSARKTTIELPKKYTRSKRIGYREDWLRKECSEMDEASQQPLRLKIDTKKT